jgi:UDP-glucose:(heptosyl)LPS alpha-1,3-glucosyltransferase
VNVVLALLRYFPYGGAQRDGLRTADALVARGHAVRILVRAWEGPRPANASVRVLETGGFSNHARAERFGDALGRALAAEPADAVVGFDKLPHLDLYFAADPCFLEKAYRHRSAAYRLTPRFRTLARLEAEVFGPGAHTRIGLIDPRQEAVYREWHGTPPERFVHLPPGTDRSRCAGPDAPALRVEGRADLGVGDDEHLVLLLGSDFRRKGLDRALRAVAAQPGGVRRRVRLLAVGQDDPGDHEALARELGIGDRLTILPGRDDVPRLLQAADLLIHPAYVENTGTVLLEALVAGLPVLCTAACGYAHHVEAADAGAVVPEPFHQEDLDAALGRLLVTPRTELRERALAWAAQADVYDMHARIADVVETIGAERAAGALPPTGAA